MHEIVQRLLNGLVRLALRIGRLRRPPAGKLRLHVRLRLDPLAPQRGHHHRLHHQQDVLAACVVRPDLRPLVRVQRPFEQRPENRRLHARPVGRRRRQQGPDLRLAQRQRRRLVKQPAVEVRNLIRSEHAARAHLRKQAGQRLRAARGALQQALQQPLEHLARQKPDVLREQAEHATHQKVRHRVRVVTLRRQLRRQARKLTGHHFRDVRRRGLWPEAPGVREHPPQQVQRVRLRDALERYGVYLFGRAREVGVDFRTRNVRDDQQRRVVQRLAVLAKLPIRFGQVAVLALSLVFPGELPPPPHVREAVFSLRPARRAAQHRRPLLERVFRTRRVVLRRRRLPQHPAQVNKMLLARRPLRKLRPSPLLNKPNRSHRVGHGRTFCWKPACLSR